MTAPTPRAQAEALFTWRAARVAAPTHLSAVVGDVLSVFAVIVPEDDELGAITRMLVDAADQRWAFMTGTARPDGGIR